MMKKLSLTAMFALFLMIGGLWAQQDSTLLRVMQNPHMLQGQAVTVQGIVDSYIPIEQYYPDDRPDRTVVYILRGDFNNRVVVVSHLETPETNTKYRVTGHFQQSQYPDADWEIIETRRATVPIPPDNDVVDDDDWWAKYGIIVLIGAGLLIVVIIVLLIIALSTPRTKVIHAPSERQEESTSKPSTKRDLHTVIIKTDPPKTMRYMPGQLEIISGEDKGKSFKMVGHPTDKGSVTTLGRAEVTGERGYSHIQLKDQTVSRKQAEIIYRDGKIMLKNLSETNYTQVNGVDVKPNEVVELAPGSIIRTGAIEFKYSN